MLRELAAETTPTYRSKEMYDWFCISEPNHITILFCHFLFISSPSHLYSQTWTEIFNTRRFLTLGIGSVLSHFSDQKKDGWFPQVVSYTSACSFSSCSSWARDVYIAFLQKLDDDFFFPRLRIKTFWNCDPGSHTCPEALMNFMCKLQNRYLPRPKLIVKRDSF